MGPIQEHTLGDKGTLEDEERHLWTPIVLQWASVTIGDSGTEFEKIAVNLNCFSNKALLSPIVSSFFHLGVSCEKDIEIVFLGARDLNPSHLDKLDFVIEMGIHRSLGSQIVNALPFCPLKKTKITINSIE